MADAIHRTTKEHRKSVDPLDLSPLPDWIVFDNNHDRPSSEIPALRTLVDSVPSKYLTVKGDAVSEMTQAEKDVIDATEAAIEAATVKATAKALIDGAEPVQALVLETLGSEIIDELRAIKGNNPKASRTIEEVKAAMKERIDNG